MSQVAADREARRQQRLRGAQRHQIPDVDFGLSFPAFPAASQQSNREETLPPADPVPQSPAKQIPQARDETNTPLTRSKRKSLEVSENEQAGTGSGKKRRLDEQAPSSGRSNKSRRDIYEHEEDEPHQDSFQNLNVTNSENEEIEDVDIVSKSPEANLQTEDEILEEEIDESPSTAPGSGRRKREVRNRHSTTQESQLSIPEVQQPQVSSSPSKRRAGRPRSTPRVDHTSTPRAQQDETDELDELSPENISSLDRRSLFQRQEQFSDDGEEEAEEIDDLEAAKFMQKHRHRDVPGEDSLEIDELEGSRDVSGVTDTATPASNPNRTDQVESIRKAGRPKKPSKASPSTQRQPKPKARKSKATGNGVRRPRGDAIPVTVYRLTKAPNYDEDADEADILISSVPYFKRAGANAVDVLSQVAEELIESGLSTLEDGAANADPRTKKEWVVKLRALTHYQQEMRPRLLELSSNLDHGYSLVRRIRAAQKQRVELREEVMRIRSEREKIALRMDEIRIKQEEDTKHFSARNEINNAFHDIENAVERGKAMPDEDESGGHMDTDGLEMLLKSVAAEVSNASDEGGMLIRVREFNSFLERAALALEGGL